MSDFPSLADWGPTREALHVYCRILGEIRKRLSKSHPLWWHASLQVVSKGITTGPLAQGGGIGEISLDLESHEAVIGFEDREEERIRLRPGLAGTELAEFCIAALTADGEIEGLASAEFDDMTPRQSDPEAAGVFSPRFAARRRFSRRQRQRFAATAHLSNFGHTTWISHSNGSLLIR